MVLLGTIVHVSTGPVLDCLAQDGTDCSGIGAMAVYRHPVRPETHGRPSRPEEGLCRLHVAVLAEHGIDQVPVPVDRPAEVGPATTDLQVGLVGIPTDAGTTPRAVPALSKRVARDRRKLRFPVANGFMVNFNAAHPHDLAQVRAVTVTSGDPSKYDDPSAFFDSSDKSALSNLEQNMVVLADRLKVRLSGLTA